MVPLFRILYPGTKTKLGIKNALLNSLVLLFEFMFG